MTHTTSPISRKKKATTSGSRPTSGQDESSKFALRGSDWLLIPIGLMVIACLSIVTLKAYALNSVLTSSLYTALWYPPLPALLIAMFGTVYIYRALHRKYIGTIAKVVTYILLAIFIVFICVIATIVGGKGHLCPGFSGMPADCSEVNAVTLYVLFANPFSLMLVSCLAAVGGVAMFVRRKSH